jgi:hypothetical protein
MNMVTIKISEEEKQAEKHHNQHLVRSESPSIVLNSRANSYHMEQNRA